MALVPWRCSCGIVGFVVMMAVMVVVMAMGVSDGVFRVRMERRCYGGVFSISIFQGSLKENYLV